MDIKLSAMEVRILGALIEKEITTPDYYPLSLNALTNACNQKSNRDPVMNLDEKTVAITIMELRFKKLIGQVFTTGGRVSKYKYNFSDIYEFTLQERSLLCELFLRGPQTIGELHTHTTRLCEFNNFEEVEEVLQKLINAEKDSFVQKLPREFGRRENRYAHLFCGEVKLDNNKWKPPLEPAAIEIQAENKRIETVEQGISLIGGIYLTGLTPIYCGFEVFDLLLA